MRNALMGNLDGDLEKLAFDVNTVKRILNRSKVNIVNSNKGALFLELEGGVYPVATRNGGQVKPYFVVLETEEAFNVSEYRMLFDVQILPNDLVMGKDIEGQPHLCRLYGEMEKAESACHGSADERRDSLDEVASPRRQREMMEEAVENLGNGMFFQELANEFSGKIKEIAQELIAFRKDIKEKIEPDIVEMASRDIPEASNQLEGINDTLESCTMKIMDINEEQMELANSRLEKLRRVLESNGNDETSGPWDRGYNLIQEIKRIIPQLANEAGQVMQFVMPDMESAAELLGSQGDARQIHEALSEPMTTIEELCKDMGDGEESISRLGEVNDELRRVIEECSHCSLKPDDDREGPLDKGVLLQAIRDEIEVLQTIGANSLSMLEPLSFQDLVGQRIQRIIKLVKTMEARIEDLIISFGIKIQKHREFPSKSYKELQRDVEKYKSELKGPQSKGEGLEQGDIDALLASL